MPDTARPVRIPLADLAVLRFQGNDAVTFLQGQLTNDVVHLAPAKACLAAWCSAKGRVLATLVVWREAPDAQGAGDTCYALVQADVAQALAQRLSMFVLRAQVKIEIAAALRVIGEVGAQQDGDTWDVLRAAGSIRIQAPASAGAPRRHWCIEDAQAQPAEDASGASAAAASLQSWRAADIAAGLPWIGAANQDMYIPQTLNLDVLGAISFSKGCYPGQEVVARSHYRGTIKRRMATATASGAAQATIGMDVFKAGDAQPCGRVINSACAGGVLHVLLEVQLADLAAADFRLGSGAGAVLSVHAVPA